MNAPRVTVVIPTWNRADLVSRAAASVIAQTLRDWELIIVDDGSEDDSVARLAAIAEPRLSIVTTGHCGIIARLRNLGAARASGAMIAFLDSDDVWLPRKLELQLAALEGGAARWCYGDYGHIDAEGLAVPQRAGAFRPEAGRILLPLLRDETAAYIGTLLIERTLFEEVGGCDESLKYRDDLDLALRLAARADAAVVAEKLMYVRDHPGRVTKGIADPEERSAIVFEKLLARETDQEIRSVAHTRRARHLAAAGARRTADGEILRGAVLLARAIAQGAGPIYAARQMIRACRARWRRGRFRSTG